MSHGHEGLIWFNVSRIVHKTAWIAPKLTKIVRKLKYLCNSMLKKPYKIILHHTHIIYIIWTMCFRLIKYILYIKIALHLLIYIFYFICNIYSKYIVGSRFSGQAQYAWDLKPVSPIQWICREWAKELGFRVWTAVVTAFFTLHWDRLGSSEKIDPRPSLGSPFFLGL